MKKKVIRLTESDLHRIVRESVRRIITESGEKQYEVDFTFFISLGEDATEYQSSIAMKDELLDQLDTMPEIVDYDVENDGEDWCINCIANVEADSIDQVDGVMDDLLRNTKPAWDYHYIKGIDNDEHWQP